MCVLRSSEQVSTECRAMIEIFRFVVIVILSLHCTHSSPLLVSDLSLQCSDVEINKKLNPHNPHYQLFNDISNSGLCRNICQNTENCTHWSWGYKLNCITTDQTSDLDVVVFDEEQFLSMFGQRDCGCSDLKYYSQSIEHHQLKLKTINFIPTEAECRRACQRASQCEYWDYDVKEQRCYRLMGVEHQHTKYPDQVENKEKASTVSGYRTCGGCKTDVVYADEDKRIGKEYVKKIFVDEHESLESYNFWLPPHDTIGKITIDLGCYKELTGIFLRNTHNGDSYNRGTENFSLDVVEGFGQIEHNITSLERIIENEATPGVFIKFNEIVTVKRFNFSVQSFYGNGGGLSFISENDATQALCSVSEDWNEPSLNFSMWTGLDETNTLNWSFVHNFLYRHEALYVSCPHGMFFI